MTIKATKTLTAYTAVAAVLFLSTGTDSMAGLFGSMTLFSEVSGTVVIGGEPCVGARLVQRSADAHDEIFAETTTDKDGRFSFPAVTKDNGFLSIFPKLTEFVVSQKIYIHYEKQEYLGWTSTKMSPEPGSETGGLTFESRGR